MSGEESKRESCSVDGFLDESRCVVSRRRLSEPAAKNKLFLRIRVALPAKLLPQTLLLNSHFERHYQPFSLLICFGFSKRQPPEVPSFVDDVAKSQQRDLSYPKKTKEGYHSQRAAYDGREIARVDGPVHDPVDVLLGGFRSMLHWWSRFGC